jgi:hypothetical protein
METTLHYITHTSHMSVCIYSTSAIYYILALSGAEWCGLLLVVPFRQFLYGFVPAFTLMGSGLYLKLDHNRSAH